MEAQLAVVGLPRLDALELVEHQEQFGGAQLVERPVDPDAAGVLDPVTAVVFSLTALALRGIVAWMMKDRTEEWVEQDFEKRSPDGTVEIRRVRVRRSTEVTGDQVDEVMRALT